jgi:hypothetical protein
MVKMAQQLLVLLSVLLDSILQQVLLIVLPVQMEIMLVQLLQLVQYALPGNILPHLHQLAL